MKTLFAGKLGKPPVFQILLLDNDDSDDVEVHESKVVNFFRVKEHLNHGGAVFITSKDSQKMMLPKTKAQENYSKSRRNMGFLFQRQLRSR